MNLKKLFKRKKENQHQYTLYSFWNKKWVYVSYISEAYYKLKDENYMMSHQNKREAIIIGEVFYSLGYNVKISEYNVASECDNRKYDIIFGLEPNFEIMCKKNPKALKIYYATGAYWKHQINTVIARTDSFNKAHNINLKYSRLVEPHNSCEIADTIFQIGSGFTVTTYPSSLQSKIKIINQSSNFKGLCDLTKKNRTTSNTEFIWFGSDGSILKGLDLVLEHFIQRPDLKLNVVGPIDPDFMSYYKLKVDKCDNIFFHGFLNTSSETFMEIAYRSSFNIFPSGSEGCPGSVVTLMQMGVIPILSRWAAFDEIEEYGYLLKEISIKEIDKAVQWGTSLSMMRTQELIKKNIDYSKKKWNIQQFKNELQLLCKQEILEHSIS